MAVLISSSNFLNLLPCLCAEYADVHAFFADSGYLVSLHKHYDNFKIYFNDLLLD
jgi:hypothetical protein